MTRTCLNCGIEFEATRSTAKFHDDACRVAYSRKLADQKPLAAAPPVSTPQGPQVPSLLERKTKAKAAVAELGYEFIDATELPKTTFIPTGFTELDDIIKGFPRRRITEIYGPPTVGKTTLMLSAISTMAGLKVLYVDMENAVDADWVTSFGIPAGRLSLVTPLVLEEAAELVLGSFGAYDLIVFDSVASALFKTEEAGTMGEYNVGVKARLMTQFMRKAIGPLARTTTALVFINQEKPTIGDMYAPKWYTPGGKALEYASSLRLRLTSNKADRIVREGTKVGKRVHVEVTKNKVGPPDRDATFTVLY